LRCPHILTCLRAWQRDLAAVDPGRPALRSEGSRRRDRAVELFIDYGDLRRAGGSGRGQCDPGLLLTLDMHAAPHPFDPHQRHRSIPWAGGSCTHVGRRIMQPGLRTTHRARRIKRPSTGHTFQPKHRYSTTVEFDSGISLVCRPTTNLRPWAHARVTRQPCHRPLPRFIGRPLIFMPCLAQGSL